MHFVYSRISWIANYSMRIGDFSQGIGRDSWLRDAVPTWAARVDAQTRCRADMMCQVLIHSPEICRVFFNLWNVFVEMQSSLLNDKDTFTQRLIVSEASA